MAKDNFLIGSINFNDMNINFKKADLKGSEKVKIIFDAFDCNQNHEFDSEDYTVMTDIFRRASKADNTLSLEDAEELIRNNETLKSADIQATDIMEFVKEAKEASLYHSYKVKTNDTIADLVKRSLQARGLSLTPENIKMATEEFRADNKTYTAKNGYEYIIAGSFVKIKGDITNPKDNNCSTKMPTPVNVSGGGISDDSKNSASVSQNKSGNKIPNTNNASAKVDNTISISQAKREEMRTRSSSGRIIQVGDVLKPFENKTAELLNQNIHHKTKLLDIAQDNLGLQEVTKEEYAKLTPEERMHTQAKVIGNYGAITDQWCAHTVSYLCEQAGIPIGGHKSGVSQFIQWAKNNGSYRPIKTNQMLATNYVAERERRASQIQDQLKNMHEGDFIIWKSQYIADFSDGSKKSQNSSHIGIIESVDIENGTVTVIEGNANEFKTGDNYDRETVKTKSEGITGGQEIGEMREVNRRDGLIRKVYTINDLANFGYSGFINNQSRVK